MNICERPIGVFDSGVGGITVLKELHLLMPNENYIYFGDSLNAPYGTKSDDEIRQLSKNAVAKLIDMNVKAVVIACNTATSVAAKMLREEMSIPIIGIEPAVKPASKRHPNEKIIVMATPVTLKREKFLHLVDNYKNEADIISLPCPGLVELIESPESSDEKIEDYLAELFRPYQNEKIGAIVLGCTHYPHIAQLIANAFDTPPDIIDGGKGTARETKRQLEAKNALNNSLKEGSIEFISSTGKSKETDFMKKLFASFKNKAL